MRYGVSDNKWAHGRLSRLIYSKSERVRPPVP